jgi:YfiH family protein
VIAVALPGAEVRFTTRAEGDMRTPADAEAVRAGLGLAQLLSGRQVHGVEIASDARDADGRLSREHGIGCMVFTADCLPVALVSGDGGVAMVHAGWRGLADGVLEAGIAALGGQAAAAAIGPAAGVCCYEVGPEVHAAHGLPARQAHIDLRQIAALRLRAAGVAQIEDVAICTICSPELHSFRRDRTDARQAGIAWLS